jgi:hypothetical protein
MAAASRLPRVKCGIKAFDDWCEQTMAAIECALNVTGSGGINVQRLPSGINLSLNLLPFIAIAQSGGSGIPARSGSTLGKGTVSFQSLTFSGGNITIAAQPTTDTAYHLGSAAVGASKYLVLVKVIKFWIVVWEDCA